MKRQRHEWRERSEDGETRKMRAQCFGAEWDIAWQLKGEEEWRRDDPVALADLRSLREKLWNKYQRKRVPYKNLEQIDELIEAHPDFQSEDAESISGGEEE